MVPTLLQQKQKRKEETRKRKTSNQSKGSIVESSKRERADSQTPKKRKRHAVIESDDKDDKKLRRTKSSDSDSRSTDNSKYEIEKIIAKRVDDDDSVYYTVRWKNYPPEADSEEPAANVDAPELIRQFEQEQRRLRKRSSERNTLSPQLPTTSRSARPTLTLRNKVVVKNVAKTPQKGSTSLPREKSASANPSLQKSAQKHPFDTVTKSPSKPDVPNVLTSRTPVEELPADNSSNVINVQSKPSKIKAPVRLTTPMMSVRKKALARSSNGLFLLGKKKFETTAGLPPKERMLLQERREREVQAIREKRTSTENALDPNPEAPTPQKICSTSIVFEQPTAASAKPLKAKLVPPPLPKKRASTNSLESDRFTESILPIAKKETSTTVASIRPGSGISSSVKSSLPKEKKSKTNERTSTPSEPQDNRMLNVEASTAISVSLTRQEANLSVTKTIRKDVKASVTQSLQSVTTRTTNDGDNSQLSDLQIDIIKREMDEENASHREEEHWRRRKEQKRQESLAERIQGAEEKKKLEAQKSAKASKKTEGIYDPRAVSPSNNDDEIFDPRAVKNHEASTNVSLQRKSPPSCLLDRGIKIEKILKLFFVKNELVGLCKYKNCLLMQIVTVEKIKEVDPQALIRAYEPLFWDTQTNE